jgi:Cu/Ag efflux pump CusA
MLARENVQRRIIVSCNVSRRDLVSTVEEIRDEVQASVSLPQGYWIVYGGQFESEAEARRTLLGVGALVVAGILAILVMVFRSTRDALIIMLNLPLALIGGVAGVFVAGGILSVASIIGLITLFGIATRNGILMISHIRHLIEKEGVRDFHEAVVRGAMERLSPILMTALASALALVPLALRMGQPGAEIQAPMAIVILFGLLSSTALNMFVVPAAYLRWGRGASFENHTQKIDR